MKRGEGPRVDPAKTRAWVERSRRRAAENSRDHGRAQLRREPSVAPVIFRARRPARDQDCFRCGGQARHWHHWLAQQHIRAFVRSLRVRSEDRERALTRELLRDERNLSAVCAACHGEHEHPGVGAERFAAEDVPDAAHEFAAQLGPEWAGKLLRAYPSRRASGSESEED